MSDHNVIIIGAGHNGLVTAAYLAKAGKKVLVLERREVIGGAAVTEEFAPGFKALADDRSLWTPNPSGRPRPRARPTRSRNPRARPGRFPTAAGWRSPNDLARRRENTSRDRVPLEGRCASLSKVCQADPNAGWLPASHADAPRPASERLRSGALAGAVTTRLGRPSSRRSRHASASSHPPDVGR